MVRRLRLEPHPEGGFYRETYRAAGRLPDGRCFSTAILFLLPKGCVSRLHRIKSDELWHFHSGGPLIVVELDPRTGRTRSTTLGPGKVQHVVKAGTWFGARLGPGADYALAGCTVAPGFEFRDFELGRRDVLLRRFPRSRRAIERLLPT
ncbi:MAG: cupin domain-containing protein [Elusimicrobia bacterium]|nr:cupin domain-containing protein [Elusimicrobiota bacterium]